MKNSTRAWILLALFSLTLIFTGHWIAGRDGVLWGLIISLSINCYIYLIAESSLLKTYSGQTLEGQDPWGFLRMTEDLSRIAKVRPPKVIITPHQAPLALVLGRNPKSGTLIVSNGLASQLRESEKQAIVAYALACLRQTGPFPYLVCAVFCRALLETTGAMDRFYRLMVGVKGSPLYFANAPFTFIATPLCQILCQLVIGYDHYYRTDKLAAYYLGQPQVLADTLWKMNSYRLTQPSASPAYLAQNHFVNPLTDKGWNRYFHPQPEVSRRIRNLIGSYPV